MTMLYSRLCGPGAALLSQGRLVSPVQVRYRRAIFRILARNRLRAAQGGWPQEDMAMARKETDHPDYHFIKVVMTNGTEYTTRSTYGKEGDTLNLDIDPNTHPAWTGGSQQLLDRGGRLSRFNSKFGNMSFGKK
jgi:large subunit ribosomal protein L31